MGLGRLNPACGCCGCNIGDVTWLDDFTGTDGDPLDGWTPVPPLVDHGEFVRHRSNRLECRNDRLGGANDGEVYRRLRWNRGSSQGLNVKSAIDYGTFPGKEANYGTTLCGFNLLNGVKFGMRGALSASPSIFDHTYRYKIGSGSWTTLTTGPPFFLILHAQPNDIMEVDLSQISFTPDPGFPAFATYEFTVSLRVNGTEYHTEDITVNESPNFQFCGMQNQIFFESDYDTGATVYLDDYEMAIRTTP